jgi:hypothetical protein
MFAEEVGTDEAAADFDDRLARDAESIRKWIHAIAAVKFDLELGPVLECVYPEKALSDTVEYAITTMVRMMRSATTNSSGIRLCLIRLKAIWMAVSSL